LGAPAGVSFTHGIEPCEGDGGDELAQGVADCGGTPSYRGVRLRMDQAKEDSIRPARETGTG